MKYEAYNNSAPATVGGWPNTFALSPFGGVGGGLEGAWRDVLAVAYEKAMDTTTVVDSALYHTFTMMQGMFPDSTFEEPTILDPEWSSSQRTTLETIAAQCPTEYGVGVYVARAMLAMTDSIPYTTQHACESAAPPSARLAAPDSETDENISTSEELTIQVYPNPTQGVLNVLLSTDEEDKGVIEIRNYLGERLTAIELHSGNNKVELGAFPSGLYFYSVLINDELVLQGKQVLLK